MQRGEVSKAVLKRLPSYLTYLRNLPDDSPPYISATMLANALGRGEVQVRKDLAIVSDGGRPKVGYLRSKLVDDIELFLGYDNAHNAVLSGAGRLGLALLEHCGFAQYGLNIMAAFDVAPRVEKTESGKPVLHLDELESFCRTNKVPMGIITVPDRNAQQVCDLLIKNGIKAVWNFSGVHLDVPENILVQNENMAASLAVLSMHLQVQMKEKNKEI